jgi:protein-disulfide isomerase
MTKGWLLPTALPALPFQASERSPFNAPQHCCWSRPVALIGRVAIQIVARCLTRVGLAAFIGISAPHMLGGARAQSAVTALLSHPTSLPEMALGKARAPIRIVEFGSMTCLHCAAFDENVFPMLRSKYIDTGKVHFVFREFPLDIKAASAAALARCIANGDTEKFYATIDAIFKQQDAMLDQTKETFLSIGKQNGLDDKAVDSCVGDQAAMDKLSADQSFATQKLKVEATPTFFINGKMVVGGMSFEEFEAILKPLLKK